VNYINISINQRTKFEVPSFTDSKNMIGSTKFKNMDHVTLTMPIMR